MKPTLCFGEIMVRISTPDHLRIAQAMPGTMDLTFAGAEANAAVTIARLGGRAEFVSALPANPIGDTALTVLRGIGVGVGMVERTESGRCGLFFVETGASYRGGLVIYDREGSSFSILGADSYCWSEMLTGAGWFHTTGIAAGVSRLAAEATCAGARAARRAGLMVSCDLNYRRKLWKWDSTMRSDALRRHTLTTLIQDVDVLIGSAQDVAGQLGEDFAGDDRDLREHGELAKRAAVCYPNLKWVAMTLRRSQSASQNRWGALLFRVADGAVFSAPQVAGNYAPYEIQPIVDRVGTGDVFSGALIFALQTPELAEPSRAVAFSVAASCLAHSTKGDFLQSSRAEVEALMNGDTTGQVSR